MFICRKEDKVTQDSKNTGTRCVLAKIYTLKHSSVSHMALSVYYFRKNIIIDTVGLKNIETFGVCSSYFNRIENLVHMGFE